MLTLSKTCAKCGAVHSMTRCPDCRKRYKREYISRNREKIYEANRIWRMNNPEKQKKAVDAWGEKNPDKLKEYQDKYRAKNKSHCNAKAAEWRRNNPDKVKKNWAEYSKANPDKLSEMRKIFRDANPMKVKASKHVRRVRLPNAIRKLDIDHLNNLMALQGGKCVYCKVSLTSYQIDHILPVAKGGDNRKENIQLLCATCNRRKGAKTHEEYVEYFNAFHK